MKKMTVTTLLLFISLRMFAPEINVINIPVGVKIEPFKALLHATGIVESNNNNLALNEKEGAYGRLQIRDCRIKHFNKLSGKNYSLTDMYDYDKAKEVFLYYASKYGPYQIEKISKRWNGSGPMTDVYWDKIKVLL